MSAPNLPTSSENVLEPSYDRKMTMLANIGDFRIIEAQLFKIGLSNLRKIGPHQPVGACMLGSDETFSECGKSYRKARLSSCSRHKPAERH